jgi:glycosyltransferase involved in cell wall biosynthesis
MPQPAPRVIILLSCFNGERFLHEQLDSLLAQSYGNWSLYWRDDGSEDATVAILEEFACRVGGDRCVRIATPPARLRPTASFLALLRTAQAAMGPHDVAAFADQDDVWLPQKLARGVAALADSAADVPALYCARQMLVDARLRRIGASPRLGRRPGFPAALAQNVTTGCTIMLNRRAVALVAGSDPAEATLHDWWCYLLVTASGGRVLYDDEPVVLYRQHGGNHVGAPRSSSRRAVAAVRRGPSVFMNVLRQHVAALLAQPHLLAPPAQAQLAAIDRALHGGPAQRLAVLRMPGLQRQTLPETMLFWLWFVIG